MGNCIPHPTALLTEAPEQSTAHHFPCLQDKILDLAGQGTQFIILLTWVPQTVSHINTLRGPLCWATPTMLWAESIIYRPNCGLGQYQVWSSSKPRQPRKKIWLSREASNHDAHSIALPGLETKSADLSNYSQQAASPTSTHELRARQQPYSKVNLNSEPHLSKGLLSDMSRKPNHKICKRRRMTQMNRYQSKESRIIIRASLVVLWLRICLEMLGTPVQSLVWEDPTCCGATKPVCLNCHNNAIHTPRAHAP